MRQYLDLLQDIIDNGHLLKDRTGVGRKKVFGRQVRFDLTKGFPLLTTKKMPFKVIIRELLWFISGSTSNKPLREQGVKIWDLWAVKKSDIETFLQKHFKDDPDSQKFLQPGLEQFAEDEIGRLYGKAWREAPNSLFNEFFPEITEADFAPDRLLEIKKEFEEQPPKYEDGSDVEYDVFLRYAFYKTIDQLNNLLISLRDRPWSSRHIISSWVPEFVAFETVSPQENVILGKGALAPCHVLQQYMVFPPKEEGGKNRLSLMMTQRSLDTPVGGPFNIAQYALLLLLIAHVSGMEAHEFIWSTGDTHVYADQIDLVKEQLTRDPLPLPKVIINPNIKSLYDFTVDDITLVDYQSHPAIPYPVAM